MTAEEGSVMIIRHRDPSLTARSKCLDRNAWNSLRVERACTSISIFCSPLIISANSGWDLNYFFITGDGKSKFSTINLLLFESFVVETASFVQVRPRPWFLMSEAQNITSYNFKPENCTIFWLIVNTLFRPSRLLDKRFISGMKINCHCFAFIPLCCSLCSTSFIFKGFRVWPQKGT